MSLANLHDLDEAARGLDEQTCARDHGRLVTDAGPPQRLDEQDFRANLVRPPNICLDALSESPVSALRNVGVSNDFRQLYANESVFARNIYRLSFDEGFVLSPNGIVAATVGPHLHLVAAGRNHGGDRPRRASYVSRGGDVEPRRKRFVEAAHDFGGRQLLRQEQIDVFAQSRRADGQGQATRLVEEAFATQGVSASIEYLPAARAILESTQRRLLLLGALYPTDDVHRLHIAPLLRVELRVLMLAKHMPKRLPEIGRASCRERV